MYMAEETEARDSSCTHDCSSCSAKCESRGIPREPGNKGSHVRHVIGVVSGKGGVGKSLVTSMLAVLLNRRGYRTAVLDADITGPSIPRAFGLKPGSVMGDENGMLPVMSKTGIGVMSVNLLMEDETSPVVWRGPVIAGTVKQFWNDVVWGEVDYMFVDMPPGTGDVPLTVFQSLPLDGIIIVGSPQQLVSMIVEKAVNMAEMMHIPVLGLVENMSYVTCPDCGRKIRIYGDGDVSSIVEKHRIPLLAELPIDPALANLCDRGAIELMESDALDCAADTIEKAMQ